jgi:hypothetical protein
MQSKLRFETNSAGDATWSRNELYRQLLGPRKAILASRD